MKPHANPRGEQRSWAEYGGVGLTPSSDHKRGARLFLPAICFGVLAALVIVLLTSLDAFDHTRAKSTSIFDTVFAFIIPALLGICGILCAIVIMSGLKRFVDDLFSDR